MKKKQVKQQELRDKIESKLSGYYFDVQGISPGSTLDEAYMARILTKIAVGTATVWWSMVELKEFVYLMKQTSKSNRKRSNASRKDTF